MGREMASNKTFEHLISELLSLPRGDTESKSLTLVRRVFLSQYYQQMTKVQSAAIPDIYNGRNVVIAAPTASGKTEAALIPIVALLLSENSSDLCIYLAPTRALLNDIVSRVGPSLERLHLTYAVKHGDIPLTKKTPETAVLFTTPESFDFLFKAAPELLKRTRWVILDEIHQLYGTSRGSQLRMLLHRLEMLSGRRVQVIAMSATIARPDELRDWLFQNRESTLHCIGSDRELQIKITYGQLEPNLRSLLDPESLRKLLVFANSRRRCEELRQALTNTEPYDVYVHYSSLSRAERTAVERDFARRTYAIGIATSTLELGIDIGSIDKVVLADPPTTVGSFVQRAGRGSRRHAWTSVECVVDSVESLLLSISVASLALEGAMESTYAFPIQGVVLQQVLSYLASKPTKRLHPSELSKLLIDTGEIKSEHLQAILGNLVSMEFLGYDSSWNSYQIGPRLAAIADSPTIHSNISEGTDGLPVYRGNRNIGRVSLSPRELREGNVMLLGGRYWKIVRLEKAAIHVSPNQRVQTPLMPHWYSRSRTTIDHSIAQRCAEILAGKHLPISLSLDDRSQENLRRLRSSFSGSYDRGLIPYWVTPVTETLTFAGDLGNAILALIITESGTRCRPSKRRGFLSLESDAPIDLQSVPEDPETMEALIRKRWRSLSSYTHQSPFSMMLPMPIRRDEITSQLTRRDILEFIAHLRTKKLTRMQSGLF